MSNTFQRTFQHLVTATNVLNDGTYPPMPPLHAAPNLPTVPTQAAPPLPAQPAVPSSSTQALPTQPSTASAFSFVPGRTARGQNVIYKGFRYSHEKTRGDRSLLAVHCMSFPSDYPQPNCTCEGGSTYAPFSCRRHCSIPRQAKS